MKRVVLLAAFALAACASEPEPTVSEPSPAVPIGDPMDPADSLLADSANYQPAPGPIPDNTTLPDTQP